MTQWHIGDDFIRQQDGSLGHAAGATAGVESALIAGKRHQPLEVAFVATYPQKTVFESAALQVGLKFLVNTLGQGFTLLGLLVNQGRVVRFGKLSSCRLRQPLLILA